MPRQATPLAGHPAVQGQLVPVTEHAPARREHPATVRRVNLTRTQQDTALQAIYDQIPVLPDCDGRCWTTCGPIHMSSRERRRIRDTGTRIPPWEQAMQQPGFMCPALGADHRCQVYPLRPVLCRLWGAVESLPCVYGCQPDPCPLADADAMRLLNEASVICGDPDAIPPRRLEAGLRDPDRAAMITRMLTEGEALDRKRAVLVTPPAFRRARRPA